MPTVIALPNGRRPVGYEFVRQSLALSAFEVSTPATIRPVSRVEPESGHLAVPAHVAPKTDNPVEHLLFALKHEGTHLQVLAQALPRIDGHHLQEQLDATPTGAYLRVLCHLWERFTGNALALPQNFGGQYTTVFPADRYITGHERRDSRWRVAFNGLGDLRMCATVARTPLIDAYLKEGILERARQFVDDLPPEMLDRALSWAYLAETRSSFAIEREDPPQDRAQAFAALLQQAHEPRAMSEDYLVELQNATMIHPRSREAGLRAQQNWLENGRPGALGVAYVPPPPQLAASMMAALIDMINDAQSGAYKQVDPLIMASVVKFAFVFIHPFMDGNGRLSRFLLHYALAQSGRLPRGMLLPVSVAMKRHELDYLQALQSFSRPARQKWKVNAIGPGDYTFDFLGEPSLYQYWDATACVEFGLRMAKEALEKDLHEETVFLAHYDRLTKAVTARIDAPNPAISHLVTSVIEQSGRISNNVRKRYAALLSADDFAMIEALAMDELGDRSHPGSSGRGRRRPR